MLNKQFKVEYKKGDCFLVSDKVIVKLKEEIVFEWNNSINTDNPEDLTWDRLISEVFEAGVKAGLKIKSI